MAALALLQPLQQSLAPRAAHAALVCSRGPRLAFRYAARRFSSGDEELNPETVSYLVNRTTGREVYMVGTAHVSAASADDVRKAIRVAKPHDLMVELCERRAERIRSGAKPRSAEEIAREFLQQLTSGGSRQQGFPTELLLKTGFSLFYAFLRHMGLEAGAEFKAALEEADRLKLKVCLADRDLDETMSRLKTALFSTSFLKVMRAPPPPPEVESMGRLNTSNLFELGKSVENMKSRKQIRAVRDYMVTVVPEIMEVMVNERDNIMLDRLLRGCTAGRTVAVVGMAHMDGIEEGWRRDGGDVFLHTQNSLRN